MGETKVIYYIDEEQTPYLIKVAVAPDKVTLGDFKNAVSAINKPNYKYFFKSMDDDFGVVKEEIVSESSLLPVFNNRVVSWVVTTESSDAGSQCSGSQSDIPAERVGGIGDSRPPSFHAKPSSRGDCDTTETESVVSNRRNTSHSHSYQRHNSSKDHQRRLAQQRGSYNGKSDRSKQIPAGYESSMLSSDLDTTSFMDSDEESRLSTTTDQTQQSSRVVQQRRKKKRHRMIPMSRASSFSSITDSTMSLNIITVIINLDTVSFLGISIVGQTNKGGDGGIYVGSIMKGGAIAQDGRIEPGDMILEVNGISFENTSNDEAVKVLREAVQKPGPITLVVAKCWDPNPKGYFTVPRQEPVRPIDPSAWVAHTEAFRNSQNPYVPGPHPFPMGMRPPVPSNMMIHPGGMHLHGSSMSSTSSSISSSQVDDSQFGDLNLSKTSEAEVIVRAMAQPESGLDIRDRNWLKITIPNAFLGSDLVDWLNTHVEGFPDRREAKKYAANLLKSGFIRHTVNKLNFSEQCYYVFGDLFGGGWYNHQNDSITSGSTLVPHITNNMSSLTIDDIDSVSEAGNSAGKDGKMPHWTNTYSSNPYGPSYPAAPPPPAPPMNYAPPPQYLHDGASYASMPMNGAESVHSGSAKRDQTCACIATHLGKQIRKLWENPEKDPANGLKPPKFDADFDQSTSSESESSISGDSQQPRPLDIDRVGFPQRPLPSIPSHPHQ